MLENIKSKYILKNLFFYISEKKKLTLLRYNKNIQTKLNIHLFNYKIFSGKYRTISENNKNVQIYDQYKDELVFEGEFSNGQINGKGKEYYDNAKLKFEGEYLNGKRNGKGKEYYKNGELKFEGKYINGKMYEGKMHNNKLNGIFELKKGKGVI